MNEQEFKNGLQRMLFDDVEEYSLINNWGFSFNHNGVFYDLRYWANCYGVALNYFDLMGLWKTKTPAFHTLDEAFKFIKREFTKDYEIVVTIRVKVYKDETRDERRGQFFDTLEEAQEVFDSVNIGVSENKIGRAHV